MATTMEPVELPSFAERARQQEARRAQVLAQRQAERDAKRQAKAKRSSLNSTDATYDPSDYAARRQKAIEQARRAEAARKRRGFAAAPAEPPAPAPRLMGGTVSPEPSPEKRVDSEATDAAPTESSSIFEPAIHEPAVQECG